MCIVPLSGKTVLLLFGLGSFSRSDQKNGYIPFTLHVSLKFKISLCLVDPLQLMNISH